MMDDAELHSRMGVVFVEEEFLLGLPELVFGAHVDLGVRREIQGSAQLAFDDQIDLPALGGHSAFLKVEPSQQIDDLLMHALMTFFIQCFTNSNFKSNIHFKLIFIYIFY